MKTKTKIFIFGLSAILILGGIANFAASKEQPTVGVIEIANFDNETFGTASFFVFHLKAKKNIYQ